jgi:hypothetical protein
MLTSDVAWSMYGTQTSSSTCLGLALIAVDYATGARSLWSAKPVPDASAARLFAARLDVTAVMACNALLV